MQGKTTHLSPKVSLVILQGTNELKGTGLLKQWQPPLGAPGPTPHSAVLLPRYTGHTHLLTQTHTRTPHPE